MRTFSQERLRVLIVDDQKNWREALCDMLDPTIYEIETATSYDEAKRLLQQHAFHVLVADQRLVDGDSSNIQGILLLNEVAELRDGTEAIIVTGYPTIKDAKAALRGHQVYDYLLKYWEGRPFNIREYRETVKEAAEKAALARQTFTLEFSVSALVAGLTYDQIAEALYPGGKTASEVRRQRRKVVAEEVNELLYPFQPLARGMGRAWLSEAVHIYEILCWSRRYGKAALIRIGREQRSLETYKAEWLKEDWHLAKNDEFVSVPFRGTSYLIDSMPFGDFVSLVEDK